MGFYTRVVIIASNLLAGVGAVWYGRARLEELPADTAFLLESDHRWFWLCSVLYGVNFFVAWRFKNVWAISSASSRERPSRSGKTDVSRIP